MNAVAIAETPEEASYRFCVTQLGHGYKPQGLHCYRALDGEPIYWRVRLKHPTTGEKWVRPFHWGGAGFVLGEPPIPAEGKPLYGLERLASAAGAILIVEGERCADVLAKVGMVALTSGSASSAGAADWTPLRGRHCVLWPDNDGPGFAYAAAVSQRLAQIGCTVETIDAASIGLPEGGDCVDWLQSHKKATAEQIIALPRVPESQNRKNRTAPEPLRRPTPPPEPYPVSELGPMLAPACASLRRIIQAPDAVCGASLLAAASLAVQGLADIHIDGRIHPLSLWFLTVAESGERKSAVDGEAMRAAREHEKDLSQDYESARLDHDAQVEQWNAARDKARSDAKKNGNGLAQALIEIGAEPPPPLRPTLIVADFTAEGLAKLLATSRPSVGAFTDEAGLVFGGHGMTKETVTRTAATLSKLWDNGTMDRVRAADGATKLWGRRLALHLMAQPVIAERALSDDVLSGQGFLARCLLAWPESTAGTRPYCADNLRNDAAMIRYHARISDALSKPLPIKDGTRNELEPRALRLTDGAATEWRAVHDAIEAQEAPGGRYAGVKQWANKAPEQCLRIAGVLTLLESSDAALIDTPTLKRAAEIAVWHLNEATRLAGTAELSPEIRDAEALLNWCHETGRELLYSGDALRNGPARIRDRPRFIEAVAELKRAGWAEPIDGGAEVDGAHRRNVWRIHPPMEQ